MTPAGTSFGARDPAREGTLSRAGGAGARLGAKDVAGKERALCKAEVSEPGPFVEPKSIQKGRWPVHVEVSEEGGQATMSLTPSGPEGTGKRGRWGAEQPGDLRPTARAGVWEAGATLERGAGGGARARDPRCVARRTPLEAGRRARVCGDGRARGRDLRQLPGPRSTASARAGSGSRPPEAPRRPSGPRAGASPGALGGRRGGRPAARPGRRPRGRGRARRKCPAGGRRRSCGRAQSAPPPGRCSRAQPLTDPFAMNQPAPGALPPPRRVRLKPWLVAQVNSCQYPGLRWVNGERKLFYIPWRHATRHGPSQDGDNTIFKAWAKETGKYMEGVDEADPAKWKANLRCALNKSRDFRLIYDGPRDMPPQPYKIYEVCSNGPTAAESQPTEDYICGVGEEEEEEEEDELQRMLPSLSLTEVVHPGPPMAPYSLAKEDVKWPPTLQPPVALGPPAPDPCLLGSAPGDPAAFGELLPEVLPSLQPGPLAGSLAPPGEQLLPDLLISPHMLPLTDLEIKFQYRGRPPRALTISNPHGCRLFYSQLEATQEQVELFGPVSLEQVRFPSPEDIPSDKQRFYTNQLLDVLDRGLILQLQGQDLYAIRLCQCKVFWSGPCASANGLHPNPIQREVKTKLFSLEHFLNELILFQKGQTNTPPPFEIFFCFGEEWPDHKPREKKLITVQVVPVAARLLLEMFSGELSWSADSIRLQISNPDLKDHMVEQFKELHHIWQSQQQLQPMAQAPPAGQGPWPMHPVGMQ